MHGRVATAVFGPDTDACSVCPQAGGGATVGGSPSPEPEDPGSLPPAPKPMSLQSGCWITQVAPMPGGVAGTCSDPSVGAAAEELAAAAIRSAAAATAAARRA